MSRANRNKPNTVADILRKIEERADTEEYIYRGELEHYRRKPYYGKISSNLYRVFLEDKEFNVEAEHFDIEAIQAEMLETAKLFSRKMATELERLAEIQHYGGKTNLIDFTADYLVALFMACDGSLNRNGRIIMQEKEEINPYIEESYEPVNRILAQKSVFVRHPNGFIQPEANDVINIPVTCKQPILRHLRRAHGISVETIYNDIHGFIKDQGNRLKVYKRIHKGLTCKQEGDSEHG